MYGIFTRSIRSTAIGAFFALAAAGASAGTITHEIVLQPIQIQSDDGSVSAPMNLFEAETDAIFMPAGIDVRYLAPNQVQDSSLLSLTAPDAIGLLLGAGNGRSPDPAVLNVYYIASLVGPFALALEGGNGIVINGTLNQPRFLAHLMGHNLELEPFVAGGHSADPNNIMHVPPGPDLSPDQIALALSSPFSTALPPPPGPVASVPLPAPALGTALLLGLLALLRRRRIRCRGRFFGIRGCTASRYSRAAAIRGETFFQPRTAESGLR